MHLQRERAWPIELWGLASSATPPRFGWHGQGATRAGCLLVWAQPIVEPFAKPTAGTGSARPSGWQHPDCVWFNSMAS